MSDRPFIDAFDFDGDGELNFAEQFFLYQAIMEDDDEDPLAPAGIDYDELSITDDYDLPDAWPDPDDFDFDF